MPDPTPRGARTPDRTRVLAFLVGAAVAIGALAALDPTTLRPGAWTVVFFSVLAAAALGALALRILGRRWSDAALTALLVCLMGLVVLSVLANQSRAGGVLNVVLLLPCTVYAAVYLSRRACRVVTAVLVVCLMVTMRAVTDVPVQWATLVALPLLAFGSATEVVLRLRRDLGRASASLRQQALTDPLTGVLNRRALQERLVDPDQAGTCTVLVLDIDHFKVVNDTLGHAVGDDVLRRFGAGLVEETREDDMVVRMGGEEFLVLTSTPADRAEEFAQTLRTRAAQWMSEWSVTVSVGVLTVTDPDREGLTGAGLEAAIRSADACLYAAKERGRNRVVLQVWPDPHPRDLPGAGATRS